MVTIIGRHFDMTDRGVRKMATENPLKYDDYLRACLCDMAGIKTEDLFAIVNEELKTNNLAEYIRLGNIMEKLQAQKTTWLDHIIPLEDNESITSYSKKIYDALSTYSDGKFLYLHPEIETSDFSTGNKSTNKMKFAVCDIRSSLVELDTKIISLVNTSEYRLKTTQELEKELVSYLDTYGLKKNALLNRAIGSIELKITKFDTQKNIFDFEFWDRGFSNVAYRYDNKEENSFSIIDGHNYEQTNYLDILKLIEKYDPINLAFFKTLTRFLDEDSLETPSGKMDGFITPNRDAWSWLDSKMSKFSTPFFHKLDEATSPMLHPTLNSDQDKSDLQNLKEKFLLLMKFFESIGIDKPIENTSYEIEVTINTASVRNLHEFISAKRI